MRKGAKNKGPRLQPKGKPSPREKELKGKLDEMDKLGPVDKETGEPRMSLRDAVELELPYAVSRRVLVAFYSRVYGVSTGTVDRAIAAAKDAYQEAMVQPKKEMLAEGKAFMRVAQNRALKLGRIADAIAAKRYELELAGATLPGTDPDGAGAHAPITADETRAIILARLAASSQSSGKSKAT